ncbi:MAG: hypothetical protein ACLQGV_03910 [Bryobacteraceae bacterium]
MIIRMGIAMAAIAMIAAGQSAAPKMQDLKDDSGQCRAAAPADAMLLGSFMARGPASAYMVTLELERGEKYPAPMTAAALAEVHYSKAFENTAARLWVERDPKTLSQGYRAFHVYVPVKGGQCHLSISFKSTTPEAAPKQIAQTLTAAK